MGFYARTLKDYDGEETTVAVNSANLNAGNIATELTLQSNFGAAINDMVLGTLQRIRYGNGVDSNSPAPTDVWAQRELKWKVNYVGAVTGNPHHVTIGTADLSLLDPNNKKYADLSNADVIAFVDAFEAYVKEPGTLDAVTVIDIECVGRNI